VNEYKFTFSGIVILYYIKEVVNGRLDSVISVNYDRY